MDELKKALANGVVGPLRNEAVSACLRQLEQWDVALPPVEPLVLDFGLNEFYKTGLIEYWLANETEAGYCGKYLFVFDGQTCPMHHHRDKKETFFLVKGRLGVEYDGQLMTMEPGDVLPVETCKMHSFTGMGPALLLEISKPCLIDDNYFAEPSIPIGGNYKGRTDGR